MIAGLGDRPVAGSWDPWRGSWRSELAGGRDGRGGSSEPWEGRL